MIEHITSINAPRLCIMHKPCCPALTLRNTGKFSFWLSERVSCCRPALLPCLFVNYSGGTMPQIMLCEANHTPGHPLARLRPSFLVCARKLHLAGCAVLKPTCPAMICDAFPPVCLYTFSRRGSASTAYRPGQALDTPSAARTVVQTFGSFGPA